MLEAQRVGREGKRKRGKERRGVSSRRDVKVMLLGASSPLRADCRIKSLLGTAPQGDHRNRMVWVGSLKITQFQPRAEGRDTFHSSRFLTSPSNLPSPPAAHHCTHERKGAGGDRKGTARDTGEGSPRAEGHYHRLFYIPVQGKGGGVQILGRPCSCKPKGGGSKGWEVPFASLLPQQDS